MCLEYVRRSDMNDTREKGETEGQCPFRFGSIDKWSTGGLKSSTAEGKRSLKKIQGMRKERRDTGYGSKVR